MERRREQGAEGFVGLCFEIVLFCQHEAKCPFKSMWHHPCCAGGLWAGRGTPAPLLCHPLCLSCPSLPVIIAWFALTPHDAPIVVTHPGASSSSFKGTRGEPEVTACHSAPSELAINTPVPKDLKNPQSGSVGGRRSQRQHGPSQAASLK